METREAPKISNNQYKNFSNISHYTFFTSVNNHEKKKMGRGGRRDGEGVKEFFKAQEFPIIRSQVHNKT